MIKLDGKLTLNADAVASPNLCDRFDEQDLKRIGLYAYEGFTRDKQSRTKWEKRTSAAMDLATQVVKDKSFPWPGASNVAFPLVTIAALQFHARAYPTIISGTSVVGCRVIGEDATGEKRATADRVSVHMSYQVLEEDQAWEEEHDRLLINLPIVGCAFAKTYHSMSARHNVSETVLAQDLVLDYYARSVESCARKTHVLSLYRNEIHERIMRGSFRDIRELAWYGQPPAPRATLDQAKRDQRLGQNPPQSDDETPFQTLEQHCALDLDQDGYAEPYIITLEDGSKDVLRIVTRFDRIEDIEYNSKKEVVSVAPMEYFTKYSFIPSPDGGIYDLGFGVLLGPLNESVSALVNQLVDAGTMSNSAGGFLGRGAKIRGGVYTFAPLEWKRVDSGGDDLHKSIFPLPVREPSAVLFQLLSLLINYVNRISGSTDTMVGENPGQNTPASNMQSMVEQGMKIYNAIFKRVWRSMKAEFRKLYILNSLYLPQRKPFGTGTGYIMREDYLRTPDAVAPVADPNITSEAERLRQAVALKQAAATTPGYNVAEVERRFLHALRVDGVDSVFPGPEKMPPAAPDVKIQVEQMRLQGKTAELQGHLQLAAAELMEEQRLNNAKITEMEANAAKLTADIQGDEVDRKISTLNAAIGLAKNRDEQLRARIELLLRPLELGLKQGELNLKHQELGVKHRELDVKQLEAASGTTAGQ